MYAVAIGSSAHSRYSSLLISVKVSSHITRMSFFVISQRRPSFYYLYSEKPLSRAPKILKPRNALTVYFLFVALFSCLSKTG